MYPLRLDMVSVVVVWCEVREIKDGWEDINKPVHSHLLYDAMRSGVGVNDVEKEKVLNEFRESSLLPLTRDTRFSVGDIKRTSSSSSSNLVAKPSSAASEPEKDTALKKRGKKKKNVLKKLPKDRKNYSREEKIAIDVMSHLPGSSIKTKPQLQSVIDALLPGYDPIDILKGLAKLGEELAQQSNTDELSISSSQSKY